MGSSKNKSYTITALAAITALGTLLHFLNISYPPQPVFDEAHFAMYAADYVKHEPFFDIHPPFGKLIYSAALSFVVTPQNVKDTDFLTIKDIKRGDGTDGIVVIDNQLKFGNFPYVLLRDVSAVFGLLLALAFYWFLRSVGMGNIGAILGALFITLENAILVETRLILMNGMYLTLGFAALALYFQKTRLPIASGVIWGLALGVKMISVIFAGPLFLCYLAKRIISKDAAAEEAGHMKKFLVAASLIFVLVFAANYVIFTPMEHLGVLGSSFGVGSYAASPHMTYLYAPLVDLLYSLGGYMVGDSHWLQSPWYFWPAMQVPMPYFSETIGSHLKQIVVSGNAFIWYSSTLAAICAIAILPRYLKKFFSTRDFEKNKSLFVLFSGFISSFLPFATIIRRSTFLYHYFPAYIFAIGLLVWFITKALKINDWDTLNLRKISALAVIVILSFASFLWTAPLTYGL